MFVLNVAVILLWFRGKRTDHGELDFSCFAFLSDECCYYMMELSSASFRIQ